MKQAFYFFVMALWLVSSHLLAEESSAVIQSDQATTQVPIDRALLEKVCLQAAKNEIASVYDRLNEHPKALEYPLKALEIQKKVLDKQHPDTAVSYYKSGETYFAMGDYAEALEYYFKALKIKEKVLGKQHTDTAISYNSIGTTYRNMGNYAKGLEYSLKAFTIRAKA